MSPFLSFLTRHDVHWKLETRLLPGLEPGEPPRLRLVLALTPPGEATVEATSAPYQELHSLDERLESLFRRQWPRHPVYQQWRELTGQLPARLAPGFRYAELGECLHTGLRKLTNTPASALAWQSISGIEDATWGYLVAKLAQVLRVELSVPTTQVKVARALRAALSQSLKELTLRNHEHHPVKGSLNAYALRTLELALGMTPVDEFRSGWLGFLWPTEEEPALPA